MVKEFVWQEHFPSMESKIIIMIIISISIRIIILKLISLSKRIYKKIGFAAVIHWYCYGPSQSYISVKPW